MEKEKAIYYPLILGLKQKAKSIQKQIEENLSTNLSFTDDINKANVILVAWWDWFLLDAISKYHHLNKLFFWINCGTLWFLLNNIWNINQLPQYLNEIDYIQEHFLRVDIQKNNEIITKYSINDITIWNSLNWYFDIFIDWDKISYKIKWTWVIITTPIWSSGYRLNWGWPLIPINSDIIGIMWIFTRPFKFDNIRNQNLTIRLKWRDKINIWVDGNSWFLEDIQTVTISKSQKTFRLWFLKTKEFETKRIMLCSEKLWWRNNY